MIRVQLQVYKGSFIIAPSHCPYKEQEKDPYVGLNGLINKDVFTVNSSLCPLCKLCKFVVPESMVEGNSEDFVRYLTLLNTEVSISINNQNFFLRKNDRIPLMILISPELFDMMMNVTYVNSPESISAVKSYYLNNESPLCYLLGCPVYLSPKLTRSKVMVVGEVEWK